MFSRNPLELQQRQDRERTTYCLSNSDDISAIQSIAERSLLDFGRLDEAEGEQCPLECAM